MGKHFTEIASLLWSSETQNKITNLYEKAINRGKINRERREFEVFRKDRTTAIVETNSVLLKKDGEIVATINIIRDITERKLAEEKLKSAHDELEQKVRERVLYR